LLSITNRGGLKHACRKRTLLADRETVAAQHLR
jgi:hypothetical protein